MKKFLATCLFSLAWLPAMAQTKSIYTDVSKCQGEDTKHDMFFYECKGPGGRVVSLTYVEGNARIVVDMDTESPAAAVQIPAGGKGKVFGEKIEWRVRDGKPCAVITRVSTDKGSRLIVTSLGKPAQIFAWDHTNKDAHRTSELACDSVGKPYTPPDEIAVEIRGDWTVSGRCDDTNKVMIRPKAFTVTSSGKSFAYNRVEEAHTFLHGAMYEGDEYAILGYNAKGDTIEAHIVVNADERKGWIKVYAASDALGVEWSGIADKPLQLCK